MILIKRYSNQNHHVHRSYNPLEKTASIYDLQGVSNRVKEEEPLAFSSLAPYESESITSVLEKEAGLLEEQELEKSAANATNPFEAFGTARHYLRNKFGLAEDSAHDLASSVVSKANAIQDEHGVELADAVVGIIDSMDEKQVLNQTGVVPKRIDTNETIEGEVKQRLMDELQLTAFQSDQLKKNVVQQARNLSTQFRHSPTKDIALAIVNVLVEHQDISLVYNISSSPHLVEEVGYQLGN